MVKNSVCFLF